MAVIRRVHKKNGVNQVRYQAQVYLKGNRVSYKTFESKWEAVQWQEQKRKFLEWESSELKKENNTLFSDCINLFQKKAIPLLQKPTQQSYVNGLKYFDSLYSVKMNQLNAKNIQNWIDWLKRQPTAGLSYRKTFRFELKLLGIVLNWYKNFVDEGFNIPITKQHKKSCLYKSIPPRRPDYFMRPVEARRWLKRLRENEEPVYWRLAVFMLLTGTRVCEACAVKWDAVNLEEQTTRIIRIIRWDFHTRKPELAETAKTNASVRLIILPDDLVKILKDMRKEDTTNDLLFRRSAGQPLLYSTIQKIFNRGFKSLNLPWRSTHILRHSYATMALLATKDLISVQASLGHKSSRTTERYAKTVALLTKDTSQKTSRIFDLLGTTSPQGKC